MRCNIEVDDLASVMQQNYEAVQVAEGQCRDGKEVDGGNLLCMIGEKCLPSLRRRRAAPDSILRHSRFRKVETEKTKFRLDPRRSPERVFERHPFDQLTNLLVDLRTADRRLGLPSPVELESLPMPFDDGLRFDNDQDLPPILAELRENHPEESIPPMQLGPVNFPVEDGQLLAQREILRHERCSWRDQAPDEQKESGDEDHKCEANHRKKDEPDDRAEWLMIPLTTSISMRDEVFGRDSWYFVRKLTLSAYGKTMTINLKHSLPNDGMDEKIWVFEKK